MNNWNLNDEEIEFLVLMYKWHVSRDVSRGDDETEPDAWFLKVNGWSHPQYERVSNSIAMKLSL